MVLVISSQSNAVHMLGKILDNFYNFSKKEGFNGDLSKFDTLENLKLFQIPNEEEFL